MPKGVKGFQKGNQSWKNWKSRPDYSGSNNPNFGRKYTSEQKKKISENTPNKGENHKDWKGDSVGRASLHDYVKKRFPKPQFCQRCGNEKPLDLSNNGNYSRELSDWEWICRSCHAKKDGFIKHIISNYEKSSSSLQKPVGC